MNDQLFINDQPVELLQTSPIAFTSQINDIADLINRSSGTYFFNVPRSTYNTKIFEFADIMGSDTEMPYRKCKAKFIRDGLEIIPFGVAFIEEAGEYFQVSLLSGNYDFWKTIEDRKLSDLDLTAWDHKWKLSSVATYASATQGVIYPVVAMTEDPAFIDNTDNQIDVRRLLPFFFGHTLVEKIAEAAGYRLEGKILTDPDYLRLIVSLANKGLFQTGKILNAIKTDNQNPVGSAFGYIPQAIWFNDDLTGDPVNRVGGYDLAGIWNEGVTGSGKLDTFDIPYKSVPEEFALVFNVFYQLHGGYPNPTLFNFNLRIFDSSMTLKSEITAFTAVASSNTNVDGFIQIKLPDGTYVEGDKVQLWILKFEGTNVLGGNYTVKQTSFVEAYTTQKVPANFLDPIVISEHVPDMTQKEFLKGISILFGIIFKSDPYAKVVYMSSYNEIEANKPLAKDWSDKLHIERNKSGKPFVPLKFRTGKYAQSNWLKYKGDTNVLEGYGDGALIVDDKTLDAETDLFKLPFASSQNTVALGDLVIPFINRFDADGKIISITPRVLLLDGLSLYPGTSVQIWDGVSAQNLTVDVPYCHFVHPNAERNLGFTNNLISVRYSGLRNILSRAKFPTLKFKLTSLDINELDHFIPIYLKYFSAYFYVSKVKDWIKSNGLTIVELARLGNEPSNNIYTVNGPELLPDPEINNPGLWTHEDRGGDDLTNQNLVLTGGAFVFTVDTPGRVTSEDYYIDLAGMIDGNYRMLFKTGHVDPAFALLAGSNTLTINFGGYSFNTPTQYLLPNTTYQVTVPITGLTGIADPFTVIVDQSYTIGMAGGEYLEITDVSLTRI